jgi:hypothetical protein
MATATTMAPTTAVKIKKDEMIRVLHEEKVFADRFISYMLKRNVRIEADLVDQLFNSSENDWHVLFSCWPATEERASLKQSLAKYHKKRWPNWWGRRAVASMFS